MWKIAIVTTTWSNDNFVDMLNGVDEYIKDKDIVVDIFNAYDISASSLRSRNELSIHLLPQASQYDGLVVFSNSSAGDEILSKVIASFKTINKPVISIDRKIPGIPSLEIDNYFSEYFMMEHMITEHKCKTFQFVGGVKDYIDNTERFRAFKDCLEKYNLTYDEQYVSFYKFLETDGMQAYRDIKNKGLALPDAVICANDKMAVGYCLEASKDGLYPPQDFLICGFDNIEEGQTYYPSITSINKNSSEMFRKSLEYIMNYKNDERVQERTLITGFVKLNESCGCSKYMDMMGIMRTRINLEKERKYTDQRYRELRMTLCACKNFEELQQALKTAYESLGLYETAICIKNEILNTDTALTSDCFSESMLCYSSEKVSGLNRDSAIKPEQWLNRSEKIYIFSPLYFHEDILGYNIIPYKAGTYRKIYHETFVDSLAIAVENIRQKITIDNMNQKFKELYVADQMTGLYNRFGYSAMSGKMFSENNGRVFIVYVDIDNLKRMNDDYGHDAGDKLIIGTADCIKKVFGEDSLKVRMGGDEFLIMGKFNSEEDLLEKEKNLACAMKRYTEEVKLPLPLEASIGHSFNIKALESTELGRMMKAADDNMYKCKQQHKMSVKK